MRTWYKLYSNILYLHFSEGFQKLPENAKTVVSPKNPFLRLLKMAGYTLLRLIGNIFKKAEQPPKLQNKVWLYVVSQNNYDSLQFLNQKFPDTIFVAGQSKNIGKYNAKVARVSLRRKFLYYYKFPSLFIDFFKQKRQNALRFYDVLYDSVGFYEVYRRKLQKYKPQAIVFANDHNADARAMLLAAKEEGIKTIYIQHASTSSLFPPLSFDLNLLEGQDSLDKYKACGPIKGKVELVGMPKADKYVLARNNSNSIQTIGIGCNLLDALPEIEKVLRQLVSVFPAITFIIRPHPRDERDFKYLKRLSNYITLSDSRSIATFDYLQKIDVQISATSGIHLEAVMLNVWSIYYDFNPQQPLVDYYGFIRNNLVDVAANSHELVEIIRANIFSRPYVMERAKYYNAAIGTKFEGRSSDISIQLIKSFIKS